MTIYCIDGFEYPTTSGVNLRRKWLIQGSNVTLDTGYKHGNSIKVRSDTLNRTCSIRYHYSEFIDLPLSGIIGFWFKTDSSFSYAFFTLNDDYYSTTNTQGMVRISGSIVSPFGLLIGSGNSSFNYASNIIPMSGEWYHVELQYQISTRTNIPHILKIDGVQAVTTPVGHNTLYNETGIYRVRPTFAMNGHSNTTEANWADHFYVKDFEGGHDGFIGPHIYVTGVYPTGNGSVNQWVASPATGNNYDIINDANLAANSYIRTSTSGNKELYNMVTLTDEIKDIFGIQYNVCYGQSGAYDGRIKQLYRIEGVDYTEDFIDKMPAIPFQYNTKVFQPTGTWTKDTFNDAEFGFEFWTTGV